MGPEAGIDLARLITEQTLAECDQEHIPQVLFSLPGQINDRTEYLLKKSGPNPADTIANILTSMGICRRKNCRSGLQYCTCPGHFQYRGASSC